MDINTLENNIKNLEMENIYQLTRTQVYSFALSILKNKTDAEDVMQDTYVNVYRYANLYKNHGKPLAWILTITKNLAFNKLKKNKINNHYDITEKEYSQKLNIDQKLFLEVILNELTSEESNIILLHEVCGFKYHEIAKILDTNISTVLSKYHRAFKKIKVKYGKEML